MVKFARLMQVDYYTQNSGKGSDVMAKCAHCGKKTTFGRNRPWSKKATPRKFHPNLQTVTIFENGRKVQKVLCAKCIRTLVKTH